MAQLSFGFNAVINCVSNPMATVYNTPIATLSNLFLRATPTLAIDNPGTCRICVNTISSQSPAPKAGNGNEHCYSGPSIEFLDTINVPRGPANVYIRADVSPCANGTIDLDIW